MSLASRDAAAIDATATRSQSGAAVADNAAVWIVWAAAIALLFVWRLGAGPLFDVDEGAFAEATREMIASGDWLHTTLNGADRFDKPILVYWLQAASVLAFGENEAAVRLPSGLCAWLWCLGVAHFARPRFGAAAAMAGATVLATSVGVLVIGHAATADALLNVLLVLTLFDLWRRIETGAPAPLRRAAVWMGLGLLAKGPIAVLIPGATLVLYAGFVPNARPRIAAMLRDPVAWLLLVAIAAPWYAYAVHRHGRAFLDGFVMRHNVGRFTTTLEGHSGGPLYYAVVLPLVMLPWTPLLVRVLTDVRATWRAPLGRWLLLWAGFVFTFFSLSGTKLPHYLLYGLTPMALLSGAALVAPLSRGWRVAQLAALGGTLALLVATPWLALQLAPRVQQPFYRALLSGAPPPPWLPAAAAIVALLLLAALPVRSRRYGWSRMLAMAWLVALYAAVAAMPWWAEALQGPVARAADAARALRAREPSLRVVQAGLNQPSFAWRYGAPVPHRPPVGGDVVLMRVDRPLPGATETLFSERGIALQRVRSH
jgi:4-amino-4-deoxy-L-arabinose transferase-like glycosyltransferase